MSGILLHSTEFAWNTIGIGMTNITGVGFKPKAALFLPTRTTGNASHSAIGVGATDGINHFSVGGMGQHNVATSLCGRRADPEHCATVVNNSTGAITLRGKFSAWLSGGVRLFCDVGSSSGYKTLALFFGGDNLDVKVGHFIAPAATNGKLDIQDVGFGFDQIIMFSSRLPFLHNVPNAHVVLKMGFADRQSDGSIKQMGYYHTETNGVGTSACTAGIRNDCILPDDEPNGFSYLKIIEVDGRGFQVQTLANNNATGEQVGYIALKYNDTVNHNIATISVPTGTGSKNLINSEVDFTPTFASFICTAIETLNTDETNYESGTFGLYNLDGTNENYAGTAYDVGLATTDSETNINTQLNHNESDGSVGHLATFTSFTSGGATINMTSNGFPAAVYYLGLFLGV